MEQPHLPLDDPDPPTQACIWPASYERGTCRSCRARIFWAVVVDALGNVRTKADGVTPVRMPIDPRPTPTGNIVLRPPGKVERIPRGVFVDEAERWQTHFASCPGADAHRTTPRRRRHWR